MFIQTEDTPNPETVKFIPGCTVLEIGTADFENAESAWRSPLLESLFEIKGVSRVFLGADFISVSKDPEASWQILRPSILGAIMAFFSRYDSVALKSEQQSETSLVDSSQEQPEVVAEIKELLDTKVRPAVAQDGGDITFERFENGIVYLRMKGACSGCPSSTITLKSGVENMLRHYIPEVQEVQAIE
tara:strand:- start:1476 stop:2039 length:564 start_codon:yes stop_codon:yes gene_type:complete